MSQRPENFNPANEDPEATLIAPRFDADDARRAHPVVPLAEAPARARRVRAPRRSWTPALLAVALLVVAALGGAAATMLMQGSRAERVWEAEQVPEQTQAAPARAAEEAPTTTQPSTAATAKVEPGEEASAKPASRDMQTRRTRAAALAPVAVEPALEDADEHEREDRRGRSSGKRREREDEVEKELRKALKRGKGKAPRLVDVLTSSP